MTRFIILESFTWALRWAGAPGRIFVQSISTMVSLIRKYSASLLTFGIYLVLVVFALFVSLGIL
jgi:hypothetical protein